MLDQDVTRSASLLIEPAVSFVTTQTLEILGPVGFSLALMSSAAVHQWKGEGDERYLSLQNSTILRNEKLAC